jgi:HlyD family secretion protein
VVSPGTVLLSIVPEHEALVAEVSVKNDDVGFVYPKQRVKVKLAAYPFEEYGMLDGEVIHLGPDASTPDAQQQGKDGNSNKQQQQQQQQPSIYKAIVALDQQTLDADGKQHKLVAGMQVVAEINQGRRTVIQYLLSPVTKTFEESGHER